MASPAMDMKNDPNAATPPDQSLQGTDLLPEPPPESNYRDSTDPAHTCGVCGHFMDGVCNLYKARVDPTMVSDGFRLDKQKMDQVDNPIDSTNPKQTTARSDTYYALSELYFSDGKVSLAEDGGLLWKEILTEGEWAKTPDAAQRPVDRPMHVTMDGTVVGEAMVRVGLNDIKAAFDEGAVQHVTIPTRHDDHLLDNTGFVRELKIEQREGKNVLLGGFEIKDEGIADRANKGLIADTSCGLLFDYVNKRTGKQYPVVLQHVALTNRPWIDGMKPFGMSEDEVESVESFVRAVDAAPDATQEARRQPARRKLGEMTAVQRLHFDQERRRVTTDSKRSPRGGDRMGDTTTLEGLELSEEAREQVSDLFERQQAQIKRLQEQVKERRADDRVEELKKMGFAEAPGFLKAVREVLLSDDDGTALLLSEDGSSEPKPITATDIVNRLVDALPKDDAGHLKLSQQFVQEETGEKPLATNEDEEKSQTDKTKDAADFLGMSEDVFGKGKEVNE